MDSKYITPGMKLTELFENYPSLEPMLNELIPAIKAMKISVVKEKVYKSTTIDIAAKSAGIDLSDIINKLRESVGQNNMTNNNGVAPEWAKLDTVNIKLDARPIIEAGEHPLTEFMNLVDNMQIGESILLITPFLPGPLIEKSVSRGLENWTYKISDSEYNNYFKK